MWNEIFEKIIEKVTESQLVSIFKIRYGLQCFGNVIIELKNKEILQVVLSVGRRLGFNFSKLC